MAKVHFAEGACNAVPAEKTDDITSAIGARFGGKDKLFAGLLEHHTKLNPAQKKPKTKQVNVPVYVTIMVKQLEDDPNNTNQVLLKGTMIQRVLFFPQIIEGGVLDDGFQIRINEGRDASEHMSKRKQVFSDLKYDGASSGHVAACTTSSFELPMRRLCIFDNQPFNITACELLIELTSFPCKMKPGAGGGAQFDGDFELRPDLMCHTEDLRNLVSVRDWTSALDGMQSFDILNPSPTVEYILDCKFDKRTGKPHVMYVPKMKITYYLVKDSTQNFLMMFMPIVFVVFANVLNLNYVATVSYPDFLANALTLALTIVFLVPQISMTERNTHTFDLNQVLSTCLFLGIVISCMKCPTPDDCKLREDCEPCRLEVLKFLSKNSIWFSNLFMAFSGCIPIINLFLFVRIQAKLKAMTPTDEQPWTFNGRPGSGTYASGEGAAKNVKGSDILLDHISPFWGVSEDGKLCMNQRLNNQQWNPFRPWKTMFDEDGKMHVFAGIRPEDILKPDGKAVQAEIKMESMRREMSKEASKANLGQSPKKPPHVPTAPLNHQPGGSPSPELTERRVIVPSAAINNSPSPVLPFDDEPAGGEPIGESRSMLNGEPADSADSKTVREPVDGETKPMLDDDSAPD